MVSEYLDIIRYSKNIRQVPKKNDNIGSKKNDNIGSSHYIIILVYKLQDMEAIRSRNSGQQAAAREMIELMFALYISLFALTWQQWHYGPYDNREEITSIISIKYRHLRYIGDHKMRYIAETKYRLYRDICDIRNFDI